MASQIVHINDTAEYGLIRRSVYGLNVFAANGVEVAPQDDPRIILMRALSAQEPCAACIGYLSIKDMMDDPAEMFGKAKAEMPYVRVPIGFYGGSFYDLTQYPTQEACFFPLINDAFWKAQTTDSQTGDDLFSVLDIMENDALCLLSGTGHGFEQAVTPFLGQEVLCQTLAREYRLIVMTGGDASDFEVYACAPEHLTDLDGPVSQAIKTIEDSNWYRQNEKSLVWSDEYSNCLKLR